jgi:hypothetical protein
MYRPPGFAYCRLCRRMLPLDDMAVMAYRELRVPGCCARCWQRVRSHNEARERERAHGSEAA